MEDRAATSEKAAPSGGLGGPALLEFHLPLLEFRLPLGLVLRNVDHMEAGELGPGLESAEAAGEDHG